MKYPGLVLLSVVVLDAACTDRRSAGRGAISEIEPSFSCRFAVSTNPIPDALRHYTDFEIRVRKTTSSAVRIFHPTAVKPDPHGGLRVDFEIKIPEPMIGEEYVVIKSHKLDGQESVGAPETIVFKTDSIP